jgi:transcriptional regulator with XRE-family HTH domain
MATVDPSMKKVRKLFEKSGKTLDALGQEMGYPPKIARKVVWQFMKTNDPHISMLRKFANAMDISVEDLIADKPK